MYPDDFRYTKDHEWAEVDGHVCRIGITQYAQEQLGDIVFVELPQVGDLIKANDTFGTIESVKAVSDLYTPVSGEVLEVNGLLDGEPERVNDDPHGDGWMIVISMSDPTEIDALMTAEQYEKFLSEEAELAIEDDDYGDDDDEDFDDEEAFDDDDDDEDEPLGDDDDDFDDDEDDEGLEK